MRGWRQLWCAVLVAQLTAQLLAPPVAAQTSREAEQVRRLRAELQQLQQEAAAQQQGLQRALGERADVQKQLDAAQAQLKAQRARLADSTREAGASRQAAEQAAQREAGAADRGAALQTALDAERQAALALRSELAQAQRMRGTLQDSYGALAGRHRSQAEGLQTCTDNNQRLQALGLELLQRYRNKGMAEVLAADEPFLQLGRVSLENLVQGYRDKLDAQAVAPGP